MGGQGTEMPDHSTNDREAYRQGRVTALVGLAIQLLLVAAMALAAAWTGSDALVAASWHMLGGVPIWAILAVVYGQREAEHREMLAAEKLSAGGSAAIFGEQADELQRSRQRLANVVGYGLPAVSILVGLFLVGVGGGLLWRFFGQAAGGDAAASPPIGGHPVGLLFASGGIALLAFGAGRWISGCARVPVWRLLRGGASYLMSCFLIAGLVMIAAVVAALAEDTRCFQLLSAAVPVVMILVGSEILGNSLLEIYRPRKPGEMPRPAFDSRLLGLLTAPESLGEVVGDLIRYQFGVEVSGSWLYRLLGRAVAPLTLLAGGVLLALSCLVVVGSDEEAVLLRFGAIQGPALPAGMHVKLPWPIETAVTYPTRRVLQLSVSSGRHALEGDDDPILWATGDDRLERIGKEYYPVVLASGAAGGGLAVIDAEVAVQYRVRDLSTFLERAPDPAATVAVMAQQEAGRYFASHDLEFLMSRGRIAAGPVLAAAIQTRVDAAGLGLEIVDVAVTALQPPGGTVARAFHRQIAARQERETIVEKARRDAVAILARVAGSVDLGRRLDAAILDLDTLRAESTAAAALDRSPKIAERQSEIDALLGEARGEAAELIYAARGARWTLAVGEQAARERFAGELLAHEQAPQYYRAARFFAVLAEGLSGRRKFVVAAHEDDLPVLRMDFADPSSAIETLLGE